MHFEPGKCVHCGNRFTNNYTFDPAKVFTPNRAPIQFAPQPYKFCSETCFKNAHRRQWDTDIWKEPFDWLSMSYEDELNLTRHYAKGDESKMHELFAISCTGTAAAYSSEWHSKNQDLKDKETAAEQEKLTKERQRVAAAEAKEQERIQAEKAKVQDRLHRLSKL